MSSEGLLDTPVAWREAADVVLEEAAQRILVIGRSDRGKSSFCRYLLGRLVAAFGTACFIDADIAQKDVGPPATVSLAQFGPAAGGEASDFSNAQPLGLYFVGAITPQGHFLDLVVGARRMADRAASVPTVIDTTGLVTGPGVPLKRAQIESLLPDVVVMIERGHELSRLAAEYRHLKLLRLPPSEAVRRRTSAERRSARMEAFRRYFSAAQPIRLPWEQAIIQRGRLQESLLCGLGDGRGGIKGLGLVQQLKKGGFGLLTPCRAEELTVVQAGELLVDPDGSHRALHGSRAGTARAR